MSDNFSKNVEHKFDLKHFPDIVNTVSEHFSSPGHLIKEYSFMPIDRVAGNWIKAYEVDFLEQSVILV